MSSRYNDFEVWEYLRGLPSQVEQALSTEGSHIVQQVVDDWAMQHKKSVKFYHVEWRRDPELMKLVAGGYFD